MEGTEEGGAQRRAAAGVLDAFAAGQDAVYVKDREGRLLMTNGVASKALGIHPEALIGKREHEVFPADVADQLRRVDQQVMSSGEPQTREELVVVEGNARSYLSTKAPLRNPEGEVIGVVGISTDITTRIEAEDELRRREALLADAQALANLGSWEWHPHTGRVEWSDECYRIVGRAPENFVPSFEALLSCTHPDDRDLLRAATEEALATGRYAVEHRIIRPSGEERVVSSKGHVDFDVDGSPLRMVGAVLDVTEHKAAQRELELRALHDPLTGLPNRTLLLDRLGHALLTARRRGAAPGVLFLDLDRFKSVNDEYGHEAGDALLVEVAARLKGALRASDTLARISGDEFVAVCEEARSSEELVDAAERLRGVFGEPFPVVGRGRRVTASIGVALSAGPDEPPERLIRRADIAMYAAKERGRDRVELFRPPAEP